MKDLKPLVIVLSRNYSTGLGVIRSLGAAGYPVDLVASVKKSGSSVIASSSRYVRKSTEVLSEKIQGDAGEGIIEVLMNYTAENDGDMVLFPADDYTASIVDANREVLSKHFIMPHVTADSQLSVTELMDKTVQGRMAKQAGLLTPEEWIIDLMDCVIPDDVVYPCFVKPLQSISGHKTEMAVCCDKYELERHLLKMKDFFSKRSVLVQEYLCIDKEYDLSGVCIDDEVVIPAIIEKTRIAEHEKGVTMSGMIVPSDILGQIEEKVVNLLQQFHYVGMFDMELNVCGDKIYFNEVNLRSGGPNFSYFLSGVNLPAVAVDGMCGKKPHKEDVKIKTYGKSFVYEKVAWEDYIYGYMTKQDLKKCLAETDFTLLENSDDPEPGKIFNKRIRLSMVKNRLKLFIKGKEKKTQGIVESSDCDVIVTGRNYCNILTMVRDLGEYGFKTDVLRVFKNRPNRFNLLRKMNPEAYSKFTGQYIECVTAGDAGRLVSVLKDMAGNGRKKLLIPVDDYMVCMIDENYEELSKCYVIPNIAETKCEIARLMDKHEQKKTAECFDLPLLHSCLIKSENGDFSIPDGIIYPCFIKPNVSMKSTKSKMARCENKEELEQLLKKYAATEDFEMLVEEYAEIKDEYSLLGFCTETAAVAPGLFRVIAGGNRERKGVAIMGETVPCSILGDVIEETLKYIKSLKYTGMFDVDFIQTADGNIYFIEVNFRAGASIRTFTEAGVNLPGMFADCILNDASVGTDCKVKDCGKFFVSEKVLMEEFARSDAGVSDIRRYMKKADICFIKDELDLQPYRYFKKYYVVAWMMRMLYKMRKRRKGK